jgi:hypothetical protein
MKLKDLKNLPYRKWNEIKEYNSLLIIPSGKKHDSGYALIYVIGCKNDDPVEIAAACDDINWKIPDHIDPWEFRNDMYYPSGIIHFWSSKYNFVVGVSLSSLDITLKERERV